MTKISKIGRNAVTGKFINVEKAKKNQRATTVVETITKSAKWTTATSKPTKVGRDASSGRFIGVDTGRVIKSSPANPRLGKECIQTVVRSYVRRDDKK